MTRPRSWRSRFASACLALGLLGMSMACAPLEEPPPNQADHAEKPTELAPPAPELTAEERCLDRCGNGYSRCLRKPDEKNGASPGQDAVRLACAADYSQCARDCVD